jgi:DHA2 family multidrug resistance protein
MSTAAAQNNPARPQGGAAPAAAGPPAGAAAVEELNPYRWLILIGLVTAAIMEVLDTTIVNVALTQMGGNLGATNQEIAWVSTGYILANVVVLPMTAFLAGVIGRKRYLTISIVLFIVSSFFCGTSHSLGELVFWRILQGAGGAALLSTAQATLRQIFPREQQGIVQALFTLGIIMAPTLGPTLGGWITDNYSWGWVFFINVPIGLVSMFLVTTFLHDPKNPPPVNLKVDWLGIGLLAVGLGCLQYVLEEGNKDDWFQSELIVRLSVISAIALAALIYWEISPRNANPVINFRVLKNREFSASLVLFLVLGFGLYGGVYIFPLFSQTILHFSATQTGLVLLPGGIATGVGIIVCGALLNGPKQRVDPRVLIFIGIAIFLYSMWDLGHLTAQSGEPDVRLALIIRGLGLGFLFTPINLVAFASLKPMEVQQGAGLINLTRQMGGSFGIAALGTYIVNMTKFHREMLSEHIYSGNPLLEVRLQQYTQLLVSKGVSLAAAKGAAMGMLAQSVSVQAQVMAYNNAFILIMVSFVFAAPAVFLLRRPKPGGAAPAADAH